MALRLEAPKPERAAVAVLEETSAEEWRRRAVQTADRLKKAERKIQELSLSANELRARLTKEKSRLDEVSALADTRQVELVTVASDRDLLKDRVLTQEQIKRAVWNWAQQMKDEIDVKVGEILGTL